MKNIDDELMTKIRALELWDIDIINKIEVGSLKGLKEIHQYLFQDVFDFAGEIRTVNLAKGNFRFAPVIFLDANLEIIEKMPEKTFDEILDKYVEMNIAHPFREGNGRATRIWFDMILKDRLGKCIDWEKIDKYDYLQAMERAPVNSLELKTLLKEALTSDIKNRQVYMRGIQTSYYYEDQDSISLDHIKSPLEKNKVKKTIKEPINSFEIEDDELEL